MKTRWLWLVCTILLTGCVGLVYHPPADFGDVDVGMVDARTGKWKEVTLACPRYLWWQRFLRIDEENRRLYTFMSNRRKARLLTFSFEGKLLKSQRLPSVEDYMYEPDLSIALSPNGQYFAYDDRHYRKGQGLRVISVATLTEPFPLPDVHKLPVTEMQWISNDQLLVMFGRSYKKDHDYADSIVRITFPGGTAEVLYQGSYLRYRLGWTAQDKPNPISPDGRFYAFQQANDSFSPTLKLLDLHSKEVTVVDDILFFMGWDSHGRNMAYYQKDIVVYSIADGKKETVAQLPPTFPKVTVHTGAD